MKTFDANDRRFANLESAQSGDEVMRLRRTVRDLVALSSLPSIWVDCEIDRSLQNLTDVLRATLRALTVCVRLDLPDGSRFETSASERLSHDGPRAFHACELLDAIPTDSQELVSIPRFNGTGPINALPHPVFAEGKQIGHLVACFREDFFPEENERLILQVAANQIMLLLQRHKAQQDQFARKLAEDRMRQALHSSEARLQSLLNLMPAAVYSCDAAGRITFYNRRAAELWGREPALNDDHQTFCAAYRCWLNGNVLAPEDTPMAIAVREGKSFRNLEPEFERPDGVCVPVLVNIDPILDANGQPAGAINVFQDITALKQAEEQLRAREQHLRAIVDNTPECVKLVTADGTLLAMNGAGLCMVEARSAEEVLGQNVYNIIAPEFRGAFRELNERVCAGSKEHLEFELIGLKGTRRWMETHAVPILDPASGQQVQLAVTRDVSERKRAEIELRRKNKQLAAFLDTAALGLHRVGPDGIILWANDAEMKMLGYAPEEYIGHHIAEFHADQPVIEDILKRLTCGETLCEREARLRCKNGSIKHVLIDSSVLWEDGKFMHTQCFTRDVTDRKRAEEALRENKALLETQKDAFQAAMRGSSLEESLEILVRRVIEFTGGRARAAFYIARPDGKALHHVVGMPEHYAKAIDGFPVSAESMACGLAVHTGKPEIAVDVEQEPKWEAYRWLARHHNFRACWSFPVRTPDSVANGTMAMYFQEPCAPTPREMEMAAVIAHAATVIISRHQQSAERERAEQALRKRGERLQLLAETLGQLISARDPETIVRELFPKVAAHLGVDTYFNFMVSDTGDALDLHSCAGIPEETQRAIGRLEFGQAICGTVAQTRQPIHATDIQHSDYDKAQLVRGFGIQCYACNPLMVGERLLGTLSFASRTRTAFDEDELQFLRIISQYTAVALDRLKSSEQLRESEERFRAVVDNSTAVIYVKDCDGKYLLINNCFERIFHVSEQQILGKTDFDYFPADIAESFRAIDLAVLRGGKPIETEEVAPHDDGLHTYLSIKFPLCKTDGAIYAVAGISTDITDRKRAQEATSRLAAIVEHSDDAIFSTDLDGIITSWNRGAEQLYGYAANEALGQSIVMLVPESLRGEEAGILGRIRQGQAIENCETLRQRKDGRVFDVSLTVSPVKDVNGNVIGMSKVARDITDKVRAKEKLEQTVAQRTASLQQAMTQMEEFSYSVSHDLRAPVRAIEGYARILDKDSRSILPANAQAYLDKITRSTARMNRLINDVLTLSRVAQNEIHLHEVPLRRLVEDLIEQYPDMQPPRAKIELGELHNVIGDDVSLSQAISNVLSNAVKFVAPGVHPHVQVWSEARGDIVRLWFRDNGIGISPELRGKLFGMFQRLRPNEGYEGTGIGLAIVRKAVERMGGEVGMESDETSGSRFWIELKKSESQSSAA